MHNIGRLLVRRGPDHHHFMCIVFSLQQNTPLMLGTYPDLNAIHLIPGMKIAAFGFSQIQTLITALVDSEPRALNIVNPTYQGSKYSRALQ